MMLKNNVAPSALWNVLEAIQRVQEIMIRKVITAKPTANLREIARLMSNNCIGGLPKRFYSDSFG
jgi:predicted transcriptional regulator